MHLTNALTGFRNLSCLLQKKRQQIRVIRKDTAHQALRIIEQDLSDSQRRFLSKKITLKKLLQSHGVPVFN
jgi:hypothetical protein